MTRIPANAALPASLQKSFARELHLPRHLLTVLAHEMGGVLATYESAQQALDRAPRAGQQARSLDRFLELLREPAANADALLPWLLAPEPWWWNLHVAAFTDADQRRAVEAAGALADGCEADTTVFTKLRRAAKATLRQLRKQESRHRGTQHALRWVIDNLGHTLDFYAAAARRRLSRRDKGKLIASALEAYGIPHPKLGNTMRSSRLLRAIPRRCPACTAAGEQAGKATPGPEVPLTDPLVLGLEAPTLKQLAGSVAAVQAGLRPMPGSTRKVSTKCPIRPELTKSHTTSLG